MVFSSLPFLFMFLPVCLICYFIVPDRIKNPCLMLFSLVFYAWGEPVYILLMLFTSYVNFATGLIIEKHFDDKKKIKTALVICLFINLALLGFFKYGTFFAEIIAGLFNSTSDFSVALPIGISFYTFQTLSYSIDVYRGDVAADKSFVDFMTYVSMFPQLIAGPIVRYKTISEQLRSRKLSFTDFSDGFVRFIEGLAKKVLLANNIGALYESLSASGVTTVVMAWMCVAAFGFQIYFDFSGYSDMAIGIGKMLGFSYDENFNYPYIAKSITDFWRRWHISLSSFFRDYVYIPLGGSRVSKAKNIRNLLIVWILTGFWHGAAYNFALWGLYYGILLIIEKFILKDFIEKLPEALKHVYALFFVAVGWVIFAFDDITAVKTVIGAMLGFGVSGLINERTLYLLSNYAVIFAGCVLLSTPALEKLGKLIHEKLSGAEKLLGIIKIVFYVVLFVVSVAYIVDDTFNPFLYFRF